MSFNVPYIGINVEKTISYIDTWSKYKKQNYSHGFDILDMVRAKLLNNLLLEDSQKQKNLVIKSFNIIKNIK